MRFILFLFFITTVLNAQDSVIKAYLFPGQGSDHRMFGKLVLPEGYDTVHITYPTPEKGMDMKAFAMEVRKQVDTSTRYVFIGVSIGGMICAELCETMKPEKVIVISSAKCRCELPGRYKFQKFIPLNKIVPSRLVKWGALFLQPIVEPDRNKEKKIFKSMLGSKQALYLKRTSNLIVNWDRKTYSDKIIHIHGTKDHTLPFHNVKTHFTIHSGSHMMMLTRGEEMSKLIGEILLK